MGVTHHERLLVTEPLVDDVRLVLPGSVPAAAGVVRHLHRRLGGGGWVATTVVDSTQTVLATAGPWADRSAMGVRWESFESLCLRMRQPEGSPVLLPAPRPDGCRAGTPAEPGPARSYLGAPLLGDDGELLGVLCGLSSGGWHLDLEHAKELTALLGRLLSTVLAAERDAQVHAREASAACELAERDRLTGLRNRWGWENALTQESLRCRRYGGPTSVLVIDLDELKVVNDSGGHAAGDELLRRCAVALRDSSRPADVVARVGGDEFTILAVECDAVSAQALLERLRDRLIGAGIAASIGLSSRRPGEELSGAWQRADEAMFRDKRRRKQRGSA